MNSVIAKARLAGAAVMVLLGLVLSTLGGCVDEPSPVGAGLFPPSDLVSIDTAVVIAHESYGRKAIPRSFFSGAAETFALGKKGTIESWALIQFPTLPDSLKRSSTLNAELRLRTSWHLGDTLGSVSLIVRRPTATWNRTTFTYDSLRVPGFFLPTGSPEQNFGSLGNNQEIQVALDTSLVNEWLRSGSTPERYGILLEPTNTSVIKGFHNGIADSAGYRPRLTVVALDSGATTPDTLRFSTVLERFVVGSPDTTFLSDPALTSLRGGAAYRGIAGFRFDQVPGRALIHQAILEVTRASSDFSTRGRDSLAAHYILSDGSFQEFSFGFPGWIRNPVQLSTKTTPAGRTVYRFTVTEFVQAWVRGSGQKRIGLGMFDETGSVDGVTVFGAADPDSTMRPKLTILYSPTR